LYLGFLSFIRFTVSPPSLGIGELTGAAFTSAAFAGSLSELSETLDFCALSRFFCFLEAFLFSDAD
jgi:hypothetical protein